MALQKQLIPVTLGTGIETKVDEKLVQPGKLLVLENAYIDKLGTLQKRNGYNIIGTSQTAPKKLATFQDELLLFTRTNLYSYVESSDSFLDRGLVSSVSVSSRQITRNTASQTEPSAGFLDNVIVYAWEDSRGGIYGSIFDDVSGLPIVSDYLISATGRRPQIVSCTRYLYVFWSDGANVKSVVIDSINPSFSAANTVVADGNATDTIFDVSRAGITGVNMILCYKNGAGNMNIGYVIPDGTAGGPVQGLPGYVTGVFGSAVGNAISVVADDIDEADDYIRVAFHTGNDIKYGVINLDFGTNSVATLQSTAENANLRNISGIGVNKGVKLWVEIGAAATYNTFVKAGSVTGRPSSHVFSGFSTWCRSVGLASKPFMGPDSSYYIVCVHESVLQPTFFTMKHVSDSRALVVNTIAPQEAVGLTRRVGHLSAIATIDSDNFIFPAIIKTRLDSNSGAAFALTGLQGSTISFLEADDYQTKEVGKNLHIAGGLVQDYDGFSVTEHGFNLYPENFSNAITAATGTLEAGTRQYVVVYEWIDNQGQIHQSTTSIPLSVTNVLNDRNTLTIPTLRVTERRTSSGRTNVSLAVYRTIVNGTVFYRVSSLSSPTLNDPTVDTVTFLDNTADSLIQSNQLLYTTGGVVDNVQPETSRLVEEYRNRLCVAGQEDGNVVQYADSYVFGSPVEFKEGFSFRVEQGGGDISALAKMDEKLIIFKNNSIYVQVGQGPLPTGAQNDFQDPQLITSDVGCPYPQSIVSTSKGIMFKSNKGYYLLDRSLQTQYVGKPVHAFNNLTPKGGVMLHELDQVRFIHSDGVCLVYNYLYDEWYTFTSHEALSAVLWQGRFVMLKTSGDVWMESDQFFDAGSYIQMRLKTPWIQINSLQGAQRIYKMLFLGKYVSSHQLEISLRYDFDDSVREVLQFAPNTALGTSYFGSDAYYGASSYYGSSDGVYQFRVKPAIQKCESFQIELRDFDSESTNGGALELTGLTFEVGVKQGAFKMRSGKSAVNLSV
jgi:hypothetical protein